MTDENQATPSPTSDGSSPQSSKPQREWHRMHLWQIQPIRDAVLVFLIVGLVYLGEVLSVITVPLLVALGFAYLVEPLVTWLTRKAPWLGRKGAVLVMMGAIVIASFGILLGTVPVIVKQAGSLMAKSNTYLANAREFASDKQFPDWLQERLQALVEFLPAPTATNVENKDNAPENVDTNTPVVPEQNPNSTTLPNETPKLTEQQIREIVRQELANQQAESKTGNALSKVASSSMHVIGFLGSLIGGIAQLGIFIFVCAFCFFFFSTSFPAVREYIGSFIPATNREYTLELIGKMDNAISGFVRGRLTICFFMGIMYAVGWTICGVPHAVLLGLITGTFGLVPYLSAICLPIAWGLLAMSLHGATDRTGFYFEEAAAGAVAGLSWWKIIVFPWIVNAVAQTMEDYVLNPMIQGKATNLHPATILLACIAGGVLGGLYGMILAIPVTACIKILMDEVMLPRLKQWLDGRRKDPLPM